jgi:hypothetical protein
MSPIKITYWPWAHGRAISLTAMAEYAQADYEFIGHNPEQKCITGNNFAVPAVAFEDGEWYSQLMVAFTALGKKLNLGVKDENELKAQNTITNIYDISSEALTKRMSECKKVDDVNQYLQTRFSQWCEVIENNFQWASKNGDGPYWEGDNVSYVDFMMIHFVEQMFFILGKDRVQAIYESKMPTAFNAYKLIRGTENVASLLASKAVFPDYMAVKADQLEA